MSLLARVTHPFQCDIVYPQKKKNISFFVILLHELAWRRDRRLWTDTDNRAISIGDTKEKFGSINCVDDLMAVFIYLIESSSVSASVPALFARNERNKRNRWIYCLPAKTNCGIAKILRDVPSRVRKWKSLSNKFVRRRDHIGTGEAKEEQTW